jgi:hypothetical protein
MGRVEAAESRPNRSTEKLSSDAYNKRVHNNENPTPVSSENVLSHDAFRTLLLRVYQKISPAEKTAIISAIFNKIGIDPADPQYSITPDATGLNSIYKKLPEKDQQLTQIIKSLDSNPTISAVQ